MSWSETPKTGFLASRLILSSEMFTAIEIDITRSNVERQSEAKKDVKRGYRFQN